MSKLIEFVGKVSLFGVRVIIDGLRPPIEAAQILRQVAEIGYKSLPLVIAAGFALGTVMTLHTRSTLVTFGAGAMIPTVQALAFFVEIGPGCGLCFLPLKVGKTGRFQHHGSHAQRHPRRRVQVVLSLLRSSASIQNRHPHSSRRSRDLGLKLRRQGPQCAR